MTLTLLALGLFALLAPGVTRDMEALYAGIDPAQPYLDLRRPLLALVRFPLALLGVSALVLGPGLMLARGLGLARSLATWLLFGLLASLLVLPPFVGLVQGLAGRPFVGAPFVLGLMLLSALLGAWSRRRAGRHEVFEWTPAVRRELALLVLGTLALAVLGVPKLFWESFNGDGAHAFEASRLLLHRPLPFWPAGAGDVSAFPGLNSVLFTWPNAWFLAAFGEVPAGVRLPFLPMLVVLYAALVAVIEHGPGRALGGAARALIGLGLLSYALVMAFSATYDPYCSDVGLPATQDTLVMITFLGLVAAFQRGRLGWTALAAALSLLASPAGPMLLGAWLAGIVLGARERRLALAARALLCVLVAFVATAGLPTLIAWLGLPAPGGEHGAGKLLDKFKLLQFTDLRRVLFVIVPAGIYPVLGLFAWRRADASVRALIVVVVLVFGVYYAIAFVSLHYFVPAMLLPLAIFWRHARTREPESHAAPPRAAYPLAFALALASVALALPRTSAIYTAAREVGESIEVRGLADYEDMQPGAFRAADLLAGLFTLGWLPQVPAEAYAGSPLAWNHYARRAPPGVPKVHLLLGREAGPGPGVALSRNDTASLHVLDPGAWEAQRVRRPRDCRGLGLYDIPRDVLFGRPQAAERFRILDVPALLGRASGDR